MFGIPLNVIVLAVLVGVCTMTFAVAFLFPKLNSEKRSSNRLREIRQRPQTSKARSAADDTARRRKNIQETLKELEEKNNKKNKDQLSLTSRLAQAGLEITKTTFFILSGVAGTVIAFLALIFGTHLLVVAGLAFFGALGLPRMVLGFLTKRRMKKFISELPDAVDIIVRGIKAGLPLNDCMRLVAAEAREPVASEFRNVIESQQLGIPMSEAVQKLHENIPSAETNFFATVIAIQQTSGGSLSEALGNLSKVLRERKKMRAKVVAISSEAKSSAAIIGSLPVAVGLIISLINPTFVEPLFVTQTGNIVLGCGAGLMFVGSMVMRQMINFDI